MMRQGIPAAFHARMVSDAAAGAIVAFDPAGKYIGRLGEGKIVRPCGLALGRDGQRLFVADAASHQVVVLDSEGEEVQRPHHPEDPVGGLPGGLAQPGVPTRMPVDPCAGEDRVGHDHDQRHTR